MHSRRRIRFIGCKDIQNFVNIFKDTGGYIVEDFNCTHRVNAASFLGMLYATSEFMDMYLVNTNEDGYFPLETEEYMF